MEQLALDDFTRYKFISSTKFSPNGENVAFVVHEMDVDENKYLSNIWLYNVPTNKISKLTSFNQESSFAWLDENNIMFSTVREEKDKKRIEKGEPFTIYYKININGGEAVKYFEIPLVVTKIESLKDGNFVLTGIYDRKTKDLISSSPEEKEKLLEKLREEKDYEILDEIPFWSNGEGFTNKKRNRLYVFSFDEKKLIPITDELTNVEAFKVSPDNSNIVYISNSFKDKLEIRSDLYLYNIYNRQLEKLTHEDPFSYAYADFMKDKIIFLGSNMKKYGVNES